MTTERTRRGGGTGGYYESRDPGRCWREAGWPRSLDAEVRDDRRR